MRLPAFRGLWTGSAIYFIGGAMLVMAASWLMVEQTGSAFLAALVQTAVFLPNFLLALPAGVLADSYDRRTLIQYALIAQAAVILLLTLLTAAGWAWATEAKRSAPTATNAWRPNFLVMVLPPSSRRQFPASEGDASGLGGAASADAVPVVNLKT